MFNKLDINDKEIYEDIINKENFFSCEYSFSTLYMWRNEYRLIYTILNNIFIIKKYDSNYGFFFMEPLGEFDDYELIKLIYKLEEIRKKEENIWLLGDVTSNFKYRLERIFGEKLIIQEEKNNFDYIYSCKNLIELRGKVYRNKRNKINQFKNTYNFTFSVIKENLNKEKISEYNSFLEKWLNEHSEENKSKSLECEISVIEDLLVNLKTLNLELIEVYVENNMIGFSIGEIFNSNICIIHVEKSLKEFNGSYAFINNIFLKKCYSNIRYVNREEDLGIEGLRRSKMSYIPEFLEKKYLVRLR